MLSQNAYCNVAFVDYRIDFNISSNDHNTNCRIQIFSMQFDTICCHTHCKFKRNVSEETQNVQNVAHALELFVIVCVCLWCHVRSASNESVRFASSAHMTKHAFTHSCTSSTAYAFTYLTFLHLSMKAEASAKTSQQRQNDEVQKSHKMTNICVHFHLTEAERRTTKKKLWSHVQFLRFQRHQRRWRCHCHQHRRFSYIFVIF